MPPTPALITATSSRPSASDRTRDTGDDLSLVGDVGVDRRVRRVRVLAIEADDARARRQSVARPSRRRCRSRHP